MDDLDPSAFYPTPSSRYHCQSYLEVPPPSPIALIAYDPSDRDPDAHLYSLGLDDNLGRPVEPLVANDGKSSPNLNLTSLNSEEEESSPLLITLDLSPPLVSPIGSLTNGLELPPSTPMSPISDKSISGVSLSAVQPGSPIMADRPLTAFSTISVSAVSEYPEWSYAESDAESDSTISHRCSAALQWRSLTDMDSLDQSTRARMSRLYAASSPLGHNNMPRKGSWDDKPTKGIASAQTAAAVSGNNNSNLVMGLRNAISLEGNIRQSRDSISEALAAQERLVLAKHPFAASTHLAVAPNPTGNKTPVAAPAPSSSQSALVPPAPLTVSMSTSRSDSELSSPSPVTPRPILVSSMYSINNSLPQDPVRHPRGGHNRTLTTADAGASSPAHLSNPPFSAPLPPSRRLSFLDSPIAPVPTHSPSSPLTVLRPGSVKPHQPATVVTTSKPHASACSPITTTRKHSHAECSPKTCCFLDFSDDDESRALPRVMSLNWLGRRRSSGKESFIRHYTHEHKHMHDHVHTHEYHYKKLNPLNGDITKPMPTMAISSPRSRHRSSFVEPGTPASATQRLNTADHFNTPQNIRFSTVSSFSSIPKTPSPPLPVSVEKASPQYILPPSQLPARRHPHAPPPLDLSSMAYQAYDDEGLSTEEESDTDETSDDDYCHQQATPRTTLQSVIISTSQRLRASSTGAISTRSTRSSRTVASQLSEGSRYSQYSSGSFGTLAPPKKTKSESDYVPHSFRRAHAPRPFHDDSDEEDENLVLDTPFAPSTWGYERDGFRMPSA